MAFFTPTPPDMTRPPTSLCPACWGWFFCMSFVWAVQSFEPVRAPQGGPLLRFWAAYMAVQHFPCITLRASAAPSNTSFSSRTQWCGISSHASVVWIDGELVTDQAFTITPTSWPLCYSVWVGKGAHLTSWLNTSLSSVNKNSLFILETVNILYIHAVLVPSLHLFWSETLYFLNSVKAL